VLKESGLDPDDFELVEEVDDPQPSRIQGLIFTKAHVTVTQNAWHVLVALPRL